MEYKSVAGEGVGPFTEKIIERSKFLTYVGHTAGEEAAKRFLSTVRGMHPLATHVCYGYVADKIGNEQRFSDDGEPQGTAGLPILGVIKAQNLRETTVAVVRYFGGIKLGAGGLTRAYSGCAAEGVDAAEKRLYCMCVKVTLSVPYADVNAAMRFAEGKEVVDRRFFETAEFDFAVREDALEEFLRSASDFFNGKATLTPSTRSYYPFPIC